MIRDRAEYSYRLWNGLVREFYRPRWAAFVDAAEEALSNHKAFDKSAQAQVTQTTLFWEENWVNNESNTAAKFGTVPVGSPTAVARKLCGEYVAGCSHAHPSLKTDDKTLHHVVLEPGSSSIYGPYFKSDENDASEVLVQFSELHFSSFRKLQYLPLPYSARNKTWIMAASCCETLFNESAVVAASQHYDDLLTRGAECEGVSATVHDTKMGGIGEWGYEFQAFTAKDQPSSDCVNMTLPSLALLGVKPHSKLEALDMLNAYYDCRFAVVTSAPGALPNVFNLIGHYFYAGFGVQRGHTAVVASEIQENINSVQAHIAFTRGAARQYRIPWAIDVSPWDAGFITDYSKARPWKAASAAGGNGGHSLSLFKRSWYLSYLSGANHLIIEAGGVNLFLEENAKEGFMPLSPLGQQAATLSTFIKNVTERAIPYAPIAIILEHAHGFGLSLNNDPPMTWGSFVLGGADRVAWSLMQDLWPGSWRIKSRGPGAENNYLVPSPYGDSFDILSEHGFTEALDLYRVVVAAGNVSLGAAELAALQQWVSTAGSAVIFASQLAVDATTLIGATLTTADLRPKLSVVRDLETGWQNHSKTNDTAPFCVSQSAKAGAAWYIKTGGDACDPPSLVY